MDSVNDFPLASPQGLLEPPLLGQTILTEWMMFPLKVDKLVRWWFPLQLTKRAQPQASSGPAFYSTTFSVLGKLGDTFLYLPGWTKVLLMVVVKVGGVGGGHITKKNQLGIEITNLIRNLKEDNSTPWRADLLFFHSILSPRAKYGSTGLTWAGTGQSGVHNRPYTCQDFCCLVDRQTKSHCWS